MTSLDLSIMPRSVGSYKLVLDSEFVEKFVYDMDFPLPGAFGIRELRSVVRLNDFRYISEVNERPLNEVNRGESAMLFIGIDEAFPCCLVYHRVLEEPLFRELSFVALSRHILDVHLHFSSEHFGSIIGLRNIPFLLLCWAKVVLYYVLIESEVSPTITYLNPFRD